MLALFYILIMFSFVLESYIGIVIYQEWREQRADKKRWAEVDRLLQMDSEDTGTELDY